MGHTQSGVDKNIGVVKAIFKQPHERSKVSVYGLLKNLLNIVDLSWSICAPWTHFLVLNIHNSCLTKVKQ